jgi:phage shock protein PspC (stress-responsive transcriptional regulator)
MNKTVTINISGIIFHIEEDAFEKLSKYISTIRGYFSKADGGNEIMSDIEARIAEMLQSKISAVKQVVLMSDVDFVMDSMGKPEEFAGEAGDTNSNTDSSNYNSSYNDGEPIKKRLYRDGDNKVVGGVCSGIGHYFGIDPVWLRIALLLMFFFAGTGFLLYLILWIAIPEAKTTTERLAMKGEKADINNISKAVKEEAEQLKKRMEKYGTEFKNMASGSAPRNAIEKTVDFLTDILANVGRVILKMLGIFLVIIGTCLFLGLFTGVFGISFLPSNMEAKEWIDMFFMNGSDFYLGVIGTIFFIGIPLAVLIFIGLRLLFKIKYSNRWLNLSLGITWVISFFLLLTVVIKTASDFNKTAKVRENFNVIQNDTLILKMHETPYNSSEVSSSDEDKEGEGNFINSRRGNNDYFVGTNNNLKYILGHSQLNIITSQSDRIEIVIVKEARGGDKRTASDRAKNISYVISQTGSLIEFDNLFRVDNADKFRFQDVKVILKLPVGKVIYLDKSLENMIYDIENVTNTYDGDMINRRWMMTEDGLKCIDCDGLISVKDHLEGNDIEEFVDPNDHSKGHVKINVNGVDINAKDAQIKVDSNGVKINSKESKVMIDKNGVHIETDKHKK